MVRREPEEENKGERGHRMTCVIAVKKLDNCPRLLLVNLPTFRLGVLFPIHGSIISGRISCSLFEKKDGKSRFMCKVAISSSYLQWGSYSTSELRTQHESLRRDSQSDGQNFNLGYFSTSEKRPRSRIQAHYDQPSEFERGRMIGLSDTAPDPGPIREIILDRAKSSAPGFWSDEESDKKGTQRISEREPLPELQKEPSVKKNTPKFHPYRATTMSITFAPSLSQAKF
ncbi:uncharacterized protein TNCV_1431111 [Trichonephila clavipes]|nr:uncharacterized protein TNCV_1431111 [Trichonephila clavipes]